MRLNKLIVFLLLISFLFGNSMLCIAQTDNSLTSKSGVANKPHLYYNTDGEEITQAQLKALVDYRFNIFNTMEYEDKVVSKLHTREKFGKFTIAEFKMFKSELESSLNIKLEDADYCIGYFHSDEKDRRKDCTEFYLSNKRWNDDNIKDKHNFIRATAQMHDDIEDTYKYIVDKDKVLEKWFFKDYISCNSWVVFRPNGVYRVYHGEGGIIIADDLDQEWDKKFIKKHFRTLRENPLY